MKLGVVGSTLKRSPSQRAASRRNLARARRKHKVRAHDTLGYWVRAGIRAAANAPTKGYAGKINTWASGDYKKQKSKYYRSGN